MWIERETHAEPASIQAALQGLGLWAVAHRDASSAVVGWTIQPHSAVVDVATIEAIPGVARVATQGVPWPKVAAKAHKLVTVAGHPIGGEHQTLIAGPCSVESEAQIHATAALVAKGGAHFLRGGAFKPRTSPYSFIGHGEEALRWMRAAADLHGLGVITEALGEHHVGPVAAYADMIQVGARNMQNFTLLRAVGATGKPVLLKRGLSATIKEWLLAGEHLLHAGASDVVFCERGVRHYDTRTRNLFDVSSIALLRHVYGLPVIADPSHAAGRRDLLVPLAKAALAAGAAGTMVEVHPEPGMAQSDGAQSLDSEAFLAYASMLGVPASPGHAVQSHATVTPVPAPFVVT